MSNSSEVERTKALFRDAIRTFAEPTTSYSEEAAGAVVVEALRLYRRAVSTETDPRTRAGKRERARRHSGA